MLRKTLISVVAVLTAYSQQPPVPPKAAAPADDGVAKFTSNSHLVIEVVTVKDMNGKAIEGLSAKDFVITEDGKPQTISFCEFQQLTETADTLPAAPAPPPPNPNKPKPDPIFQSQITPEKPGDRDQFTQ